MNHLHRILEAESVERLLEMERECVSHQEGYQTVFKRYFLSDPLQADSLPDGKGAVSVICQPPLSKATAAVWLWLVSGAELTFPEGSTLAVEGDQRHLWTAGITAAGDDSFSQMSAVFLKYGDILHKYGMTLEANCIRTWIHVSDIDSNYSGVVKGRMEHFDAAGMTSDTHYIASTGIQGTPCTPGGIVQMDAYAVLSPDLKQRYLYAPTHLNPTYEYGVTFERGVRMTCGGCSATFISGTASIGNRGEVVHVGDVVRQTLRMWENVEKLLEEAHCGWDDVSQMIVYLRNASDYDKVAPMFAAKFPGKPCVLLLAPVCRPQWLIEMECMV